MKTASSLALILAAIASSASSSSFLGVQLADPVWMIEAAQDAGSEKLVKDGDMITSARLIPGGVVSLDGNLVDVENGKVLIAKGAELFLYNVGSQHFFCVIGAAKVGGGLIPCLIDNDRDMRFDLSTKVALLPSTGRFGAAIPLKKSPYQLRRSGITNLIQSLERPAKISRYALQA